MIAAGEVVVADVADADHLVVTEGVVAAVVGLAEIEGMVGIAVGVDEAGGEDEEALAPEAYLTSKVRRPLSEHLITLARIRYP
jgi:hypothetical protein